MKNFKKIAVTLSLTAAIGIGSFAYASDFNAQSESNETVESKGGHCYERENRGHRHDGTGHHKHNRNHRGRRNNNIRHKGHKGMQDRR